MEDKINKYLILLEKNIKFSNQTDDITAFIEEGKELLKECQQQKCSSDLEFKFKRWVLNVEEIYLSYN